MYLVFDTETGGLDPKKHSLLTACFAFYDTDGTQLDKVSIKVRPPDGIYRVTAQALKINKINLVEHDSFPGTNETECAKVTALIDKYSAERKLNLLGHRLGFDMGFVEEHLPQLYKYIKEQTYKYTEDTACIAKFLGYGFKDLVSLASRLKIEASSDDAHNAEYDTELTAKIYFKLKELNRK